MNSKLYVGNLARSVSEADLRTLFSQAGSVTGVELMLDPASGHSRGYGFVTMATPELAATALNDFHSYNLGGRYITVTEARPAQEPKGAIGQGFDFGTAIPFTAGNSRGKHGGGSAGSFRRRHRNRGH